MEATLRHKAEPLASERATQAQTVDDLQELRPSLRKCALERLLATERDVHRGRQAAPVVAPDSEPARTAPTAPNRRHGHAQKTVRGALGELPLDLPRARQGTFAPHLIPTPQRRLRGFDDQILTLYAQGMTTRDIQDGVQNRYEVEVAPPLVSESTAELESAVPFWRQRRLDPVWPIVYRDGSVVHVPGDNGRVTQHTRYVALGVNLQGKKDLLGLGLSETEGAKFWLSCWTDLKHRGVQDLFIGCGDGLTGFPEALRAVYPQTKVHLCLVHLVRAARKYVTDNASRPGAADLKKIEQSATVAEAEQELDNCAEVGGEKYPTMVKQWRLKWHDLSPLVDFPPPLRKAISTTNAIASVHRVSRKFTGNRTQYPNAASALTMVYLAIQEAAQKWTMPMVGWKAALNHCAILFEDRRPKQRDR
jgi:putative transposase